MSSTGFDQIAIVALERLVAANGQSERCRGTKLPPPTKPALDPAKAKTERREQAALRNAALQTKIKCGDSIPQYRLERGDRQLGIPMSRSTTCDLFHRAADELRLQYTAALAVVPAALDVHADETTIRQLGLEKRTSLWAS